MADPVSTNDTARAWIDEQGADIVLVDMRMVIQCGGEIAPFGHKRLAALVNAGHLVPLAPEMAPVGCYRVKEA